MNSEQFNKIFNLSISDYHSQDDVSGEPINPFKPGRFDFLLYHKSWIDNIQWHLEDLIRDPIIDPVLALNLKRQIDKANQERTDIVEQIDHLFLEQAGTVKSLPDATLNTESPAWAIDRLSILALKIYHMQIECGRKDASREHIEKASQKLSVLLEQQKDLCAAIDQLISDIMHGRKYMRVYKQMKMYNDETMNPVLYQQKK
jgi:hypothetical protein